MDDLSKRRALISQIDEEMARLFEKRMETSAAIAAYKKEHGLSVKDKKREELLLSKNREYIRNPDHEDYYVNFMRSVIDISCRYQEKLLQGMNVSYCGVEGAFAYIAAKSMFPEAKLVCKSDFNQAYKSVESGECDAVVLPLENSYAGEVGTVMDLAFSGSLYANQVYELPVEHYLLGIPGASRRQIKRVISHPQALMQCSEYILEHGFEAKEYVNTALAAKSVKESADPSVAAIASKETAELMGLEILDEHIQDSGVNTTRFAVFSRSAFSHSVQGGDSFILVYTVKNVAGALAQTLNIIGAHGYNMKSVRSRPLKGLLWNYYFFIEADGNINNQNGQDMLRELAVISDKLKVVGSYHTLTP